MRTHKPVIAHRFTIVCSYHGQYRCICGSLAVPNIEGGDGGVHRCAEQVRGVLSFAFSYFASWREEDRPPSSPSSAAVYTLSPMTPFEELSKPRRKNPPWLVKVLITWLKTSHRFKHGIFIYLPHSKELSTIRCRRVCS
jgi:hypothetical protein